MKNAVWLLAAAGVSFLLLAGRGALAQQGCGGSCSSGDDCAGQLTCIDGQCTNDPDVGSNQCGGGTCSATQENPDTCCEANSCTKTTCSPPVSSDTPAILTLNNFEAGGDGGGASQCDNQFHNNSEMVVALSTGWFDNGNRCGKQIVITSVSDGATATATVVDQCDSTNGCDSEHAGQPPCRNNVVDASDAVWQALGVSSDDSRYGSMAITWADA